jgi:3-mercaptopyruvate sulfurtransferase SseA
MLIAISIIWFQSSSGGNTPETQVNHSDIPFPEVPRVRLEDAKAAQNLQTAVFVDVRGKEFFDSGHISGALSIPEEELPEKLSELNKDDWIITYCT